MLSIINRPSKKPKTELIVATRSVKTVVQNKNVKPKKRAAAPANRNSWLTGIGGDYLRSLNDPFLYGPVRLGYNTMVPTQLATLVARGTMTVNTDGSLAIVVLPVPLISASSPILTSAGIKSTTSWGTLTYSNASVVAGMMSQYRAVSAGLRAFPLIASTSVAGLVYSGALPTATYNQIIALTPQTFPLYPETEWGDARVGAVACGRPIDNRSYAFNNFTLAADNLSPFSVPYIYFEGLPAGTSVAYEIVLNLEGIRDPTDLLGASVRAQETGNNAGPQVSDVFPTSESAWSRIKTYLDTPGVLSADLSKASRLTGELVGAASALGSAYTMFQRGGQRRLR